MTDTLSIVGSTQASVLKAPVVASADASTAASSANDVFSSRNSDTPISPRIIVDPLAGVITQFLSATGQLESQIPSTAVVAYLRAGLTSEGYAKPTPESQQENAAKSDSSASTAITA